MSSIRGCTRPWCGAAETESGVDVDAATSFLRAQSSPLARRLRGTGAADAVGIALARHEASHATWIELIAAVECCRGQRAAACVADVYACHGEVVGSLECRLHRLLAPEAAVLLHRLLAQRLDDLTEKAVAALATSTPE